MLLFFDESRRWDNPEDILTSLRNITNYGEIYTDAVVAELSSMTSLKTIYIDNQEVDQIITLLDNNHNITEIVINDREVLNSFRDRFYVNSRIKLLSFRYDDGKINDETGWYYVFPNAKLELI